MTESSNKAGEAGFEMCVWSVSLFAKAESSKARALRCAFWAFWLVAEWKVRKTGISHVRFERFGSLQEGEFQSQVGWGGAASGAPPPHPPPHSQV